MIFWQRRRRAAMFLAVFALTGLLTSALAWADAGSGLQDFRAGRFSEAYQAWREAAERGDGAAALYLGVSYDTGFGVATDYRQALAWYERAGEAGNATGMFNAGVMYDAGRGTGADPARAAAWYRRAAAKHFGRAEYNLALLYDSGSGVARDRAQAVRLYRDAARDGIGAAREHLAMLGERAAVKVGPPQTDTTSASFDAAQRLLLTRGTEEMARAVTLFRKAAEQGNPLAAYNLAYCYEHGLGVAADPAQALAWYRRSASGAGDTPIREIAEAGARTVMAGRAPR